MTDALNAKAPAPIITRVVQGFGIAAIAAGAWGFSTRDDCQELECLVWFYALFVVAWGVVALLAGMRGPLGLAFLIGAVLLAMVGSWVRPLLGIVFLAVLLVLVNASKDRLAGYYRRSKPKVEAS